MGRLSSPSSTNVQDETQHTTAVEFSESFHATICPEHHFVESSEIMEAHVNMQEVKCSTDETRALPETRGCSMALRPPQQTSVVLLFHTTQNLARSICTAKNMYFITRNWHRGTHECSGGYVLPLSMRQRNKRFKGLDSSK